MSTLKGSDGELAVGAPHAATVPLELPAVAVPLDVPVVVVPEVVPVVDPVVVPVVEPVVVPVVEPVVVPPSVPCDCGVLVDEEQALYTAIERAARVAQEATVPRRRSEEFRGSISGPRDLGWGLTRSKSSWPLSGGAGLAHTPLQAVCLQTSDHNFPIWLAGSQGGEAAP
jgi:hypothetical protein